MSWRPKNWTTPYRLPSTDARRTLDEREAFEAGADAMLEALKKEGTYSDGDAPVLGYGKGWNIIIPDKEVN